LEICYLRRRFEEQFPDFAGRTYIGNTGAFNFDNIGAEDVKLFLLRQTYKSFLFLTETMDIFVRLAMSSKPISQPSYELQILKQAAGHLRWKVDYPPSQPVGSRFKPHWRSLPAKLPSFGGYSLETLPYLSVNPSG